MMDSSSPGACRRLGQDATNTTQPPGEVQGIATSMSIIIIIIIYLSNNTTVCTFTSIQL